MVMEQILEAVSFSLVLLADLLPPQIFPVANDGNGGENPDHKHQQHD